MRQRCFVERRERTRALARSTMILTAFAPGKQWVDEWEQPRWRQLNRDGMAASQAGHEHEALRLFREAYTLHPSAEVLNNIAVGLERTGLYREAHATYLRTLNANANNNGVYRTVLGLR
eukprot:6351427-Prymnesium_polylepis.3